jgi:predicted ester cyclase
METAGEQSTQEQNRHFVRHFVERMMAEQSESALDECLAPGFIDHNAPPDQPPGREGAKHTLRKAMHALSNMQVHLEDLLADGDKVVIRYTAEATHVGSFMGYPGTGNRLTWTTISIYRVEDGHIVERWGLVDHATLLHQLRGS